MRALGPPLQILNFEFKDQQIINSWFDTVTGRLKMYSGAADPATGEVPKGQWIVYKNTTLNEIRVWVNDDGTLKKSAAFT